MKDIQPPAWEKWVTREETMRRLSLTKNQLDYLVSEGILNQFDEGRGRWILQYDVDNYRPRNAKSAPTPAPESFEPEPEITQPDTWIPAPVAAEILNITCSAVNSLARRGKLTRKVESHRALFLESAVFNLAHAREKRRNDRRDRRNSLHWWGNRARDPKTFDGDFVISTSEAAQILGVHYQTVTHLVRRGLLPAFQKRPGQQGSPLQISAAMVRLLADRPDYKRRKKNAQEQSRESVTKGWTEQDIRPVPRRGHTDYSDTDRGEFYSTRQAAALLGVHPSRIRAMARTGRLTAIQHKARMKGPYEHRKLATGNRWFFFRKEEVHALQFDPEYCERHDRYVTGCKRKAEGPSPEDVARLDKELDACIRANRANPGPGLERLDPADPPGHTFTHDDWRIALE